MFKKVPLFSNSDGYQSSPPPFGFALKIEVMQRKEVDMQAQLKLLMPQADQST